MIPGTVKPVKTVVPVPVRDRLWRSVQALGCSLRTVGAGAESDVEHDDRVLAVLDLVQHAPVPTEPSTVNSSELIGEGLADPLRILEQRTGDELDCSCGDLVREPIERGPGELGLQSRACRDRSRGAVVLDEGARGFGSEDDITSTDGLTGLDKSAQSFGVGLDLLGFAQGKVGLDGVDNFLLHAAVVLRGGRTQGRVEIGWESQGHRRYHDGIRMHHYGEVPVEDPLADALMPSGGERPDGLAVGPTTDG